MSNIALSVEEINKLQPLDIVNNPLVRQRFITIYDTLWGNGRGEAAYEREANYFNHILGDDERLQRTTKFSIFTSFVDLAISGLSLEPGTRALCYLMGRNHCIGTDNTGKKIYEPRLTLTVSGYGELVMRARAGQIRFADNPVLVYEEDEFSFSDKGGRKMVDYTCHFPHTSGHIVACYLCITRADGTKDYSVMLEEDWLRLQGYSARSNRRWDNNTRQWVERPNELYNANGGRIDPGFLMAKCIKHAFKTYPKVRIGKYTAMESEQIDEPQPEIDDFYGVADPTPQQPAPAQEETFAPQPDLSAGVTVDPALDSEDDGTF